MARHSQQCWLVLTLNQHQHVLDQAATVVPSGWIMSAAKAMNQSLHNAHIQVWEYTTVVTVKMLVLSVMKVHMKYTYFVI